MRLASLDFGSNTVGYLVADWDGENLLFRERESRFVRLAEGLRERGTIAEAAQARALEWCREMREKLAQRGVDRLRAVGTEALRRASNGARVRGAIEAVLDVPLAILTGPEEGQLCFRGVRLTYPDEALAVLDVGGGSTELSAGASGPLPDWVESVPLGAVVLTERHGEEEAGLRSEVERALASWSRSSGASALTVTGGTGANLAMLDRGETVLRDERVEGHVTSRSRLRELSDLVAPYTPAERSERFGIPERRADVMQASFAIVDGVCARLGLEVLRASRRSLRHGVLAAWVEELRT